MADCNREYKACAQAYRFTKPALKESANLYLLLPFYSSLFLPSCSDM